MSGDLPGDLSFLTLQPETLALSAVKRSERGDQLIVRFYNPTDENLEALLRTFRLIYRAWEVNLNEEDVSSLAVPLKGNLRLASAAKEVKTVALEFDRRNKKASGPNT